MLRSNTSTIDLNMLPQLLILLKERHVSRAARVLGISQPAMSRLLEKARKSFEDKLLERPSSNSSSGYVLTPLGRHLLHTLEKQLPELAAIAKYKTFDPLESERSFALSASEIEQLVLLPALLDKLHAVNCKIRIYVSQSHTGTIDLLDQNKIDLAFWVDQPPERFSRAPLFSDRLSCLVGPSHPHRAPRFTLVEYANCRHVRTPIQGLAANPADPARDASGMGANVRASTPSFLASAMLCARTDLVASVPSRLAGFLAGSTGTRVVAAPDELAPFQVYLIWNSVMDSDPGLAWLVGQICKVATGIESGPDPAAAATDRRP